MDYVLVKQGSYRNRTVNNVIFRFVKGLHIGNRGTTAIRVTGIETQGFPNSEFPIYLSDDDFEFCDAPKAADSRSDAEIKSHIQTVFDFLELLVEGAATNKVRSTIISGGAGVGKSYGTEKILRENSIYDRLTWNEEGEDEEDIRRTEVVDGEKRFQPKYSILKGATSPVILYATLFKYSNPGEVLVLDDCDSIFADIDSLNILKAALDTGDRRYLTYSKDSNTLKERGVPQKFEYKGSVIFITNVDFENYCDIRSNSSLTPHLKALMSRTHYLDIGLHSHRERLIQIQMVQEQSGFLYKYGCDRRAAAEVIEFMAENSYKLREVSLRSAISIAEKRALAPDRWRQMVQFMEFTKQYRVS